MARNRIVVRSDCFVDEGKGLRDFFSLVCLLGSIFKRGRGDVFLLPGGGSGVRLLTKDFRLAYRYMNSDDFSIDVNVSSVAWTGGAPRSPRLGTSYESIHCLGPLHLCYGAILGRELKFIQFGSW